MSLDLSSISQDGHLDQLILHSMRNKTIISMIGNAASTGYKRGRITVGLPTEGSECIQAIDATITYAHACTYMYTSVHTLLGSLLPSRYLKASYQPIAFHPLATSAAPPCPLIFVAVPVRRRRRRRLSDHPLPRWNRYLYRFQVQESWFNLHAEGVYTPCRGVSHDVLSSTHPARLGGDATGSCSLPMMGQRKGRRSDTREGKLRVVLIRQCRPFGTRWDET